jgi:hypothetical protein
MYFWHRGFRVLCALGQHRVSSHHKDGRRWPHSGLTNRPRASRKTNCSDDDIAPMPSLCAAAASDEIRRLIRARAAIANARSIFTTRSAQSHFGAHFLAFSSAWNNRESEIGH